MSEKGELDLTGAKQNTGMWLVKVPKYLSQQWTKASGRGEVGKLRIAKNQGRTEVSFTLNEDLASINDIGGKPASVSAPREHPFLLQSVGGQTLTVFTESSAESQPEEKSENSNAGILLHSMCSMVNAQALNQGCVLIKAVVCRIPNLFTAEVGRCKVD
ncbi:general transcription factor IIF subunit 2-like [Terrapene carolina triunguis]|uniref:general transcription factor IIF subunit 2 n=1 Tax=Terrapene triunguis TaxID=2587831 RepID=UPI000CEFDE2F|nr:general transcription factor IIF subunit 2 [Terrapene carolina triunguis]XP_026503801.1 general transcription factor IIF subunit 2-like [Terrapene carolina triunguis]